MRTAESPKRVFDRATEADLGERPLQLLAHRVGDLLRDGFEALHERETGPQRAREQRQRVGQLTFEALAASALAVVEVQERCEQSGSPDDQPGDRTDEHREEQEGNDRERGRVEEQLRRRESGGRRVRA